MALYLVQHGKSAPKSVDPQKGLTAQGREEVERIASVAAGYGVRVDRIVHSGKMRAAQTAEVMAQHLKPTRDIGEQPGLKPLDDVVPLAAQLTWTDNLMIVGHLPFLERLVSWLIMEKLEKPLFRLQNGGILCLVREPETDWVTIKWALMPAIG